MIDAMKVKRSVYFVTLQGYVIFETELYMYKNSVLKQDRFKPASNFILLIAPRQYFCGSSFCFMSLCLKFFCAVGALCMFSYF